MQYGPQSFVGIPPSVSHITINNRKYFKNHYQLATVIVPAIPFWDFLNCNSDLVAQVTACVDDSVRAFAQNNSVTIFIIFVVILQKEKQTEKMKT